MRFATPSAAWSCCCCCALRSVQVARQAGGCCAAWASTRLAWLVLVLHCLQAGCMCSVSACSRLFTALALLWSDGDFERCGEGGGPGTQYRTALRTRVAGAVLCPAGCRVAQGCMILSRPARRTVGWEVVLSSGRPRTGSTYRHVQASALWHQMSDNDRGSSCGSMTHAAASRHRTCRQQHGTWR